MLKKKKKLTLVKEIENVLKRKEPQNLSQMMHKVTELSAAQGELL